ISAERTWIQKAGTDDANLFVIGDAANNAARWRMKGLLLDFTQLTDTPTGVAIKIQNSARFLMEDVRIFDCATGIQLGSRDLGTTVTQSDINGLQCLLVGAAGGAAIDDQGSNN